jgi:arylsulfatase A-like enzyme
MGVQDGRWMGSVGEAGLPRDLRTAAAPVEGGAPRLHRVAVAAMAGMVPAASQAAGPLRNALADGALQASEPGPGDAAGASVGVGGAVASGEGTSQGPTGPTEADSGRAIAEADLTQDAQVAGSATLAESDPALTAPATEGSDAPAVTADGQKPAHGEGGGGGGDRLAALPRPGLHLSSDAPRDDAVLGDRGDLPGARPPGPAGVGDPAEMRDLPAGTTDSGADGGVADAAPPQPTSEQAMGAELVEPAPPQASADAPMPSPGGDLPVPSADAPFGASPTAAAFDAETAPAPVPAPLEAAAPRPNIVTIAIDDMNAFASVFGGYPGPVHMPNLERLAGQGVTFTNAFSTVPLCNPARASVLSGMSPLSTGILNNVQSTLDYVDPAQTLPAQLGEAGYTTVNAGKVFHASPVGAFPPLYDTALSYGSLDGAERGRTDLVPTTSTVNAGVYTGDPANLGDAKNVARVEDFLAGYTPEPGSAGLFLSIGLTSTHSPRYVPQEYYDLYPLEDIVLPETPPGDLADISDFALQFINEEQFAEMVAVGDWPRFIQAYLACLSFMDDMLGRILDAIESSAIGGNTVVVLWSDHGFHLGEKTTTGKVSPWETAARAPLIIADPAAPSRAGAVEDQVVSGTDIYTTILDYAGVAKPAWADGESLVPLVQSDDATGLPGFAVTQIDGNFSFRTEQYRYIRYEEAARSSTTSSPTRTSTRTARRTPRWLRRRRRSRPSSTPTSRRRATGRTRRRRPCCCRVMRGGT